MIRPSAGGNKATTNSFQLAKSRPGKPGSITVCCIFRHGTQKLPLFDLRPYDLEGHGNDEQVQAYWCTRKDCDTQDENALAGVNLMGVISANSLSLGALAATRFRFTDRVVSFLMAFGGGALTLDPVAHGIASGHFVALGVGWVLGGLLFVVLNNAINDIDGFPRKVSTTMHQLRRQERRRFREFLSGVKRFDIFSDLPERDYDALRAALQQQRHPAGSHLVGRGDPPNFLYLIDSDQIELSLPGRTPEHLGRMGVIGRRAFVTGAPNSHSLLPACSIDLRTMDIRFTIRRSWPTERNVRGRPLTFSRSISSAAIPC